MNLQVLFLETGQEERPHSGMFREHGRLCLGCDSVFKRDMNCLPGILSASQWAGCSVPQAVSSPSSASRHLNRFQVSLKI